MKKTLRIVFILGVLLFSLINSACHVTPAVVSLEPKSLALQQLFPSAKKPSVHFNASIIASPLAYTSNGQAQIIVPVSEGTIAVLDSATGALLWQLALPRDANQDVQLIATPVLIDKKLVVVYQCVQKGVRVSHHLVVLDMLTKQLDPAFPRLTFAANLSHKEGGSIAFLPSHAYSHAALRYLPNNKQAYGMVYVAFGNASDNQPFHGWLFTVDINAWLKQGAEHALADVFVTTPEVNCPAKMEYGTQEMVCGGGIWTPAGILLSQDDSGTELLVPTGNGQVDLARHDYANALLRIRPGHPFEDGCDKQLCAAFNPLQPDLACLRSCKNLFIPRLARQDAPLKPPNHECDDKNFWECLAWMDYDLGSSSPIKVKLTNELTVLLQPGKEGAVYLLDAKHLGVQYDRLQVAELCGSPTDLCRLSWAGMMVTQPVLAWINNEPVIMVTSFSADNTHIAGVVALKIVLENKHPKLAVFWRFPSADTPAPLTMFRSHPSLPALTGAGQNAVVWVVDIGTPGILYGLRVHDGKMLVKQPLQGSGRQLATPLFINDKVYVASMQSGTGKAILEGFQINQMP